MGQDIIFDVEKLLIFPILFSLVLEDNQVYSLLIGSLQRFLLFLFMSIKIIYEYNSYFNFRVQIKNIFGLIFCLYLSLFSSVITRKINIVSSGHILIWLQY